MKKIMQYVDFLNESNKIKLDPDVALKQQEMQARDKIKDLENKKFEKPEMKSFFDAQIQVEYKKIDLILAKLDLLRAKETEERRKELEKVQKEREKAKEKAKKLREKIAAQKAKELAKKNK